MFKSEKGNAYVNWAIGIIVVMFLLLITIKVLIGENGLIQQMKENKMRNNTEKNIIIELTDENSN